VIDIEFSVHFLVKIYFQNLSFLCLLSTLKSDDNSGKYKNVSLDRESLECS
jgi:hypothetical protein